MSESRTFKLITPIDDVTELTIEEPTVAEIAKLAEDTAKHGATRALVGMIAAQTKLPATTISRLKARDFTAIDRYLNDFFDEPPETSGT